MNRDYLDKLLQSKKYRGVCPDTVRRVWAECEARYKKPKDADKAAREALHGITGAFMTPQEAQALSADIQAWHADPNDANLERMLSRHSSTRERLPLHAMDALYDRIFEVAGRPRRVLDLACGINPLYLGARGVDTVGVDISGEAVSLINAAGETCYMPVRAVCGDLLCENAIPGERFDVALLFKVLPLLERQRAGAALDVMNAIDAAFLVTSFPTRTLGGRNVGMSQHYAEWMEAHLPEGRTVAARFETENELFYILKLLFGRGENE